MREKVEGQYFRTQWQKLYLSIKVGEKRGSYTNRKTHPKGLVQ
jgi:hypothetical protein